jgi:hypothetical protein
LLQYHRFATGVTAVDLSFQSLYQRPARSPKREGNDGNAICCLEARHGSTEPDHHRAGRRYTNVWNVQCVPCNSSYDQGERTRQEQPSTGKSLCGTRQSGTLGSSSRLESRTRRIESGEYDSPSMAQHSVNCQFSLNSLVVFLVVPARRIELTYLCRKPLLETLHQKVHRTT